MLARGVQGVSLIEIMIGMALFAILLLAAVPTFTTFMQNARLRAVAESFQSGLQLARTEAIKRNGRAELVVTDDEPVASNVNTATAIVTGQGWIVRFANPATGFNDFVEGKSSLEGSAASGSTVAVAATDATIAFNSFGATTLMGTSTFQFTNPSGGACASASGPMRCLNVTVTPSGQIKMCDPSILTVGDTRKC